MTLIVSDAEPSASASEDDVDSVARLLGDPALRPQPQGLVRAWARHRVGELLADGQAPAKIDRFTILERAGAGGMCVVFAAWDPRLERRVALKILREPLAGGTAGLGPSERLEREAKAMARLSHPNVAAVYDIGTVELEEGAPSFYIAMEFIEGEALSTWQRRARPSVTELLDAYIQAGRGLQAAHDAQLVHRDFKPHNAMRDSSGRVRVLDFGLVRVTTHEEITEGGDLRPALGSGSELTHSHGLVGTPAYMAPEQLEGLAVDARSDQFSFCVSLFEALFGERPFPGKSPVAIADAMATATTTPTRRAGVPARVRRALTRGLEVDPSRRWPRMADLVRELERARAGSRWRWWIGGVAVASGLAAWWWPRAPEPCTEVDAAVRSSWDDGVRAELRTAMIATDRPFAADVASRVDARLDSYATELGAAYGTACRATQLGQQSSALLDRQTACLDTRHTGLQAAIRVLREPGPEGVERALDVVGSLGAIDPCLDRAALLAVAPPADASTATAVAQLREELADAEASRVAGRRGPLSEATASLLHRAEATAYRPLVAEVQYEHGQALQWDDHPEAGCASLADAHFSADANGQHELAVAAASRVLECLHLDADTRERAELWYRNGRAAAARLEEGTLSRADLEAAMGRALFVAGDTAEGLERQLEAMRILEPRVPPSDPRRWNLESELSATYVALHRFDDARAAIGRARAAAEESLGRSHPDHAVLVANAANAFVAAGELVEGERLARDAVALLTETRGREHSNTLMAMGALATAISGQERWAEAAEVLREVHDGLSRDPDGDRFLWAAHSHNYASVLHELGRTTEAIPIEREVLEWMRANVGEDDRNTAMVRSQLGKLLAASGELEEAEELLRAAVASAQAADDAPRLEHTLSTLAHFQATAERYADAEASYRQLRDRIAAREGTPYELAVVDVRLAELDAAQGRSAAAHERATAALVALRRGEPPPVTGSLLRHDPTVEEVEALLARVRPQAAAIP